MGIAVVLLYVVRANNDLYVLVFAILIFVEWLRVVAVAIWRRKRWAWIVGLGFVPLILIKNPLNFVNNFAALSVDLADELADELDAGADKTVAEIRDDLGEILTDLKQNAYS